MKTSYKNKACCWKQKNATKWMHCSLNLLLSLNVKSLWACLVHGSTGSSTSSIAMETYGSKNTGEKNQSLQFRYRSGDGGKYEERNSTNKSCISSKDTSLKQLANHFISPCGGMNVFCSDVRKQIQYKPYLLWQAENYKHQGSCL